LKLREVLDRFPELGDLTLNQIDLKDFAITDIPSGAFQYSKSLKVRGGLLQLATFRLSEPVRKPHLRL